MKVSSFIYIILVLASFVVIANGLAQPNPKLTIENNTSLGNATQDQKSPANPNIFFGVFAIIF